MKKNLFLALALCLLLGSCATKKNLNVETEKFRYELECAGNGIQGTYLVKVWSYSKKAHLAASQAKKNAVHGVIFKGFVSQNDRDCKSQRALAPKPGVELEYKDFFNTFFSDNNGEYMKYVSLTSAQQEIIKVGKEYKVGITVSVNKEALRKALEEAGVIKSLNYGF